MAQATCRGDRLGPSGEHPRAFTAFTLSEYARLALVAMRDLSLDPAGESELVAELALSGFVPATRTRSR